ncbi:hypothetical protein MIND_01355000 [Mycena indigotica]|uniref:SET domain-containing protein n=1 Tax=Mycena indigotica TaxID=2126181 RepID=A0A8H6RZP7_9AGAR|nr:uncharacterized protein MIND_01355000 [Mycena indigotica]KAF7289807.1 hypothetical protein MIND_01355000 [Mycena indigotica]
MSFAQLKATRNLRNTHARHSYVTSDPLSTRLQAAEDSIEHQVSNPDPTLGSTPTLYKSIPSSLLEVKTDATKGRGLWTKQRIPSGQNILALLPYAAALSSGKLSTYCSLCSSASVSPLRCTQCQMVYYCDATCQSADWPVHKFECPALRRCIPASATEETSEDMAQGVAIPGDAVRCLARMMWRKRRKGLARRKKLTLCKRVNPPATPSAQEQHTHLALSLVRFLGLSSPQELAEFGINSGAELAQIVAKFTPNTFTLSAPDLTPIGACISPPVALINHSCQPNAVVVFSGSDRGKEPILHVVTIREVEAGQEILTAYIDTTLPRIQRQHAIKETYNFDCVCVLCGQEGKRADPRESVWCSKRCGGLCPMPTEEDPLSQCDSCNTVLRDTDAVLDATRVGQQGLDKAQTVQFSDRSKSQQLTTNLIPILASAGLTPASHPLLALRRLHLGMLIEDVSIVSSSSSLAAAEAQKILDEAVITATQVCAGLDMIMSYGHPVRGLARAELGKLLAVDEPEPRLSPPTAAPGPFPPSGSARLRLALDTLLLAREELKIGFGVANEGGDIGRVVREDIVRLEKELGIWKARGGEAMRDAKAGNLK